MSVILAVVVLIVGMSILIISWTDAPNTTATVISTRVLHPKAAIAVGVLFNLFGVFLLGSAVAATMANIAVIGTGREALVALGAVQLSVIIWLSTAWRYGIPTSGTHAMIAALMGAGISYDGFNALNGNSIYKVLLGMFISSIAGFMLSFFTTKLIAFFCENIRRRTANRYFSYGQIMSVSLLALSNGAQDGQTFMGILYFALVVGGVYPEVISGNIEIPLWVMVFCATLMSVGISFGGYRIIKKMGMEMVQLEKYQGFAVEIVAAGSMIASTLLGIPMSSTNLKGAAMMGAGASKGLKRVNWSVAKEMIFAWLLTFPVCMALGYIFSMIVRRI